MKDFVSFFLLLIIITIFYIYLETKSLDVIYVKSTLSDREYLVRNLPDKQKAADLLNNIHINLVKIIEYCSNENNKENYTEQNKEDIKRLVQNYRNGNLSESNPGNKFTSYSINKGEKIVFCIRSKDGLDTLVDLNTMMFVAIHELAHLMTKSIGHNEEFWENMKFLLRVGLKIGVYEKQAFSINPVSYCGIEITDTPLKE